MARVLVYKGFLVGELRFERGADQHSHRQAYHELGLSIGMPVEIVS